MNSNPIYVVMVMTKCQLDERGFEPDFGSSRIVGFYHSDEEAIEAVQNNKCDIREYTYDFALVEKINPGLYGATGVRQFFRYTNDYGYVRIIPPSKFKYFMGFTIG